MRRWLIIWILLLAAGASAYFATGQPLPFLAKSAAPRAAVVAIPVTAVQVTRTDVPIFLAGLGTVQAFNSVLVKSRVDGQIIKINFTEGKDVHAGDILVEIDPAPYEAALAQAQANKLKDQAQLDNARLDLERMSRLVATNAVPKQQLDTARALVAQLDATIKADQAIIDMAQTQLNYSRIRSPIDGRTGARLVDAGNIVRTTDTTGIVTVNQLDPIFVNFSLPADSLPQIRSKKDSGLKVTAQDSSGTDLANGKLSLIDNQINPATGTINYKATFDNKDEVLWPGQFVNARVEVDVRRHVVAVPITAVQQGPDGPYVFVVDQNRMVQKRAIKVGHLNKSIAVIDDGLQPDETVVTEGQYRIQAGSIVDVHASPEESPR